MGFTTSRARRELAAVDEKLREYERLLERKRQLEQFLSLGEQLSTKRKSKSKADGVLPIQHGRAKGRTVEIAASVLRRHGNLHLSDLLKQMRAVGWAGSGDDKKDGKAVYVALLRMPERFVKVGRNIWALREAQTKAAS